MKQILLSIFSLCLIISAKSQTVLNEVYAEPGGGNSEFIELYNNAIVGTEATDCFTILTYWSSGANKGWYALDLPAGVVASKGWYVLAAANPFNTQSTTGSVANVNWNDPVFRSGATGGYLKKYQVASTTYTEININTPVVAVADLSGQGDFANGQNYMTLLFKNGAMINGFWGGGPTGILPVGITGMPDLMLTPAGVCGAAFTVDFSTLGAVENVNSSPGTNNGYARTSDGKCGAWVKTSASVNHTPGVTNGGAAGLSGALVTSQVLGCNTGPATSTVTYNITGVSGDATEASDFPIEVQLYYDFGTIGQLDGLDVYQSSQFDALIADGPKTFTIAQTQRVILVYKTKRGCFDKVVALSNGCLPLPVDFKSFTAARNRSNVLLKWETMTEQNNRGFAIERNTGNNVWQEVAFVPSQVSGGNSSDLLAYQYVDANSSKGVTQYRIRQVDNDNRSKYSQIRSVRGDGQAGKTLVYPNPSNDGRVNIVFEDKDVVRDIAVADMSGRIIKQLKGVSNNSILIDNLSPGMYSIRILSVETGEQVVEKIVVNKR